MGIFPCRMAPVATDFERASTMKARMKLSRREMIRDVALGFAIVASARRPVLGQRYRSEDFLRKRWTVGFSNASLTNTWRVALREAIVEAIASSGNIKLLTSDANDSPAKQVADLEDLLARAVDGLIIGATTIDVASSILEQCAAEGVPTVIVDRKVASNRYTTFVSSDNRGMAAKGLGKLLELVGGRGKIAVVQGIPGAGPAVERNLAYDALLKAHPGVRAVRQAGDWSRASGQRVTENILTANPDLNGIHFDGGEMAVGGIQALRAAGLSDETIRAGRPFLTWLDGYNGGLKMIKAGLGKFTVLHPPRLHGRESVTALIRIFKGESVPKSILLPAEEISSHNVDKHVALDKPDDYWVN
ncbi:MAG: sugar ABC transporter substrate-binding protein [Acidimicrobiia bacterium]|nr:sugar ABC transporter substrate-binding protein [Acidimicrobiia bacterium]